MYQENIAWRKWRWEFMRRNAQYKSDFNKVKELRKSPNFTWVDEREYCLKYGLRLSRMIDPEKSFEEIGEDVSVKDADKWSNGENIKRWAKQLNRMFIIGGLDPGAVEIVGEFTLSDGRKRLILNEEEMLDYRSHLLLHIDFNKVNSLDALKRVISELLEKYYDSPRFEVADVKKTKSFGKNSQELILKEKPPKKQRYMVDYDLILQVGDLKEKGFKNREIAMKISPGDFKEENEKANPESAIRKVSHYYKKYKELIGGGYKNISYP